MQFVELHQEGKIIAINRDSIQCVTPMESKKGVKFTKLILIRQLDIDNMFPVEVDESYTEVLELLNQE